MTSTLSSRFNSPRALNGRVKIAGPIRYGPLVTKATNINVIGNPGAKRSQAVVIGGGICGLLTSHVLCRHFDQVVLIEKDVSSTVDVLDESFNETAKRRKGVPQIIQPHQLIAGAVESLDRILPNFRKEVISQGGVALDLQQDVRYFDYGGVFPQKKSTLRGLGVTRRFLEQCLRNRIIQENTRPNGHLTVFEGFSVSDLKWNNGEVIGVVMNDGSMIDADIVLDSSGRKSMVPEWLEKSGLTRPRMISVDPHVSSASRMVAMPDKWSEDWKLLVCKTQPHGSRGGTLLPTENNMWQVTLAEINGPPVPKDDEGFLEYARQLPDKTLYRTLLNCEPKTPVINYNAMKNEIVCYHEIDMPKGLLVLGDSVQRLNAIYGQGMALAAKGVEILDKELTYNMSNSVTDAERLVSVRSMGQAFQKKLHLELREAWNLATGSDLRYPSTTSIPELHGPGFIDTAVLNALIKAAQADADIYQRMLSVAHLVEPSRTLFADPKVMGATFYNLLFRR